MNTKTKLPVTPAEASELLAQGYEIECYLILPSPESAQEKRGGSRHHLPKTVVLGISVRAKEPVMGAIAKMWPKVKKEFFTDPTKVATRLAIEKFVIKEGGKKNHVSQFIHAYKCLRVVEPEAK